MRMTIRPSSWNSGALRLVLGAVQMFGAVVSAVLLLELGAVRVSLFAVVLTSVATTLSVLLFGSQRDGRK